MIKGQLDIRMEHRHGWGMANHCVCRVLRVTSAADVQAGFKLAAEKGWKVSFWGNGRSYGDAALNESNLLLDFRGMNGVLAFDEDSGELTAEPGITMKELEYFSLPRGFWPPVVSGTSFTTLGGCIAANVHGKNNYKYGPWGDHVVRFTIVTADGALREVDRQSDPELFHFAIGGFGLLGAMVSITVKMKRVHSGRIGVQASSADNIDHMFRLFEDYNGRDFDYVVGWVDGFPGSDSLGRGQVHAANYLKKGEDIPGERMMRPKDQEPGDRMFGVLPKSWLWWLGKPAIHRWGFRLINVGRYWAIKLMKQDGECHLETHIAFNHLLDFVPNWQWIYKPSGLIQFQLFLTKESALPIIRRVLELNRAEGLESWLIVMKRHRPDPFPLSHAVDGYSFAMDYPVNDRSRERLLRMTEVMSRAVVDAGGRFYFAKDTVVRPEVWRKSLGDAVIGRFFALKRKFDPKTTIQGNLWRRVMAPLQKDVPLLEEKLSTVLEVQEDDRESVPVVAVSQDHEQ